ncbi:hypothetical protein GCM10009840_05960 [Pseudolysinimonas kribbensis]
MNGTGIHPGGNWKAKRSTVRLWEISHTMGDAMMTASTRSTRSMTRDPVLNLRRRRVRGTVAVLSRACVAGRALMIDTPICEKPRTVRP